MKKLKTPKRSPTSRARRRAYSIILKISVTGAVVAAGLMLAWRLILALDYFAVKEIIVRGQESASDLSYLKGRNILTVDLNKESRYILQTYPKYKRVKLIRLLPNKLYVEFVRRVPVGRLKLYKQFLVDEEQVLCEVINSGQSSELPEISGLETKIFGPKLGARCNVKELAAALLVIQQMADNDIRRDYQLSKIDFESLRSISVTFTRRSPTVPKGKKQPQSPGRFEVRLTLEDVPNQIRVLTDVLLQVRRDWQRIDYIDLRFKEPVIKFYDVQ